MKTERIDIIGRSKEIDFLDEIYQSDKSEFVAVLGRRRVGKTFLIRNAFQQEFSFYLTGYANASLDIQLDNFYTVLKKYFPKLKEKKSINWVGAFQHLIKYLEQNKTKRKLIFIDELPWLDTPNSDFLIALEHFWNTWASARKDIVLIVCGSAASWMVNKLINNKGGLHNRITQKIKLLPFTLQECEQFIAQKKSVLDRYQIAQLYMVLGGIPYYWDQINRRQSAAQNIQRLCFTENGILRTEFENLLHSLFGQYDKHTAIVKTLSIKSKGLTRNEILKATKLKDGGSVTRLLSELEESGFIRKYNPFGKLNRDSLYQLVDFYTLFYFKFISTVNFVDDNYWLTLLDSSTYRAWSGYAFENVCLYHLPQIKRALGISGMHTQSASWRSRKVTNAAQIDLVIDRKDNVISICEMKFANETYEITKAYEANLRNKLAAFRSESKTKKALFLAFITTFGIVNNARAASIVQNNITLKDLFN
jgi:AAA+ ATPase superfamily predicted ATPase